MEWIWCNAEPQKDEYGEFVDNFSWETGKALLTISADSNYAAFVNGRLAAWGQYADYPYDKVYDEVDITEFCNRGSNRLAILVWYYGLETSSVYYPGKAGLLYKVECGKVLCQSGAHTRARLSRAYESHRRKIITGQLGYSFRYNATREDDWRKADVPGFGAAVLADQTLPLRPRPCAKLFMGAPVFGTLCKQVSPTNLILDLGKEYVGFLCAMFTSPCDQEITLSFGEHLADGQVRRIIGNRDFSISCRARAGENRFLNPFRRLGCRYLQVRSERPLEIRHLGIAPTTYPVEEKPRPALTELQAKIYDACVETLRLCMHEHYEDCPWREQAMYAMDSRNQMLCGYHAFGETRFPRACLELMAKDQRTDGLLSICYPSKVDLVIPSFSLHYITACREYLAYSGDKDFLRACLPKLRSILEVFLARLEDGLLMPFRGENYWNFYEWAKDLGNWNVSDRPCDLLSNALLVIALENMAAICDALDVPQDYRHRAAAIRRQLAQFRDANSGVFYNYLGMPSYSQLGNSLAILSGAVTGEEARSLCEKLLSDPAMTPVSLSMRCFLYDALLRTDEAAYKSYILADIARIYTPMLEAGSTTVWETERGQQDFGGAGSLCHGWSAMPVYYYHKLLK